MKDEQDDENKGFSIEELEIFERVLDKQITITGDLKLAIRISITPLEKAEEMGLDLPSLKGASKRKAQPDTSARQA